MLFSDTEQLPQIITLSLIGLLLFGYFVSYEISADFTNHKHFGLFGITIFKLRLKLNFPDNISILHTSFKQTGD